VTVVDRCGGLDLRVNRPDVLLLPSQTIGSESPSPDADPYLCRRVRDDRSEGDAARFEIGQGADATAWDVVRPTRVCPLAEESLHVSGTREVCLPASIQD